MGISHRPPRTQESYVIVVMTMINLLIFKLIVAFYEQMMFEDKGKHLGQKEGGGSFSKHVVVFLCFHFHHDHQKYLYYNHNHHKKILLNVTFWNVFIKELFL